LAPFWAHDSTVVYVRYGGDTIQLAPPLIVEKAEIDRS